MSKELESALVDTFDAAYEAEWERVAESAEGSDASGVADRAATLAGIRAVHAALLAKIEAADRLANSIESYLNFDEVTMRVLEESLAAYRNQQPAGGGE